MKRCLVVTSLMLILCISAAAQLASSAQSFTEVAVLAPPAIVNSQTSSNSTGTGVQVSSTGGSVAAGTWRICVAWATNAATTLTGPCSVDTAATSVVTTTGSTSTIIVQPPYSAGVPPNVVGYEVWVGASGGTAGNEVLQTPTAANCVLSTSVSIATCALTSPMTFTSSSGFGAGTAPTSYAAFYPPLAAKLTTYEGGLETFHYVNWVVAGTAPATCAFSIAGASTTAIADLGQSITCTSSGGYALPSVTAYNYIGIDLSTFSLTDGTTTVAFYLNGVPFNPMGRVYYGNAVPSGTCLTGAIFDNTAGAVSTTAYTCNAGTWTAITVP
jgi:hypothetical protein